MDDLKIATISAASHTYSCAAAPIQKALAKVITLRKSVNDFQTNLHRA